MRERSVRVKFEDPTHLARPVDEEVRVHPKVVNRVSFSVEKVEDKALPQVASIHTTGIEVG